MQLTKNINLSEFEASSLAARHGIDNSVPQKFIPKAQRLANMLQFVRAKFGPMFISSGYRCPELNKLAKGSATSQHMQMEAADIKIAGVAPINICRWVASTELPFDQLIHEYGQWVHVSIAPEGREPRRQLLTIDKLGTRPGILEVRK